MAKLVQIPPDDKNFTFLAVDIERYVLTIEKGVSQYIVNLELALKRTPGFHWYFKTLDEATTFVNAYFGHVYIPMAGHEQDTLHRDAVKSD